jgi:hypothetical protein
MKAILVVNTCGLDFEKEVDAILALYQPENLIDIKYSDNATQYSALIIVKK